MDMYNAANSRCDSPPIKPVSPRKKSSSSPRASVFRLLLLLGVLQDALGFQAPPCLLESPSLNAAVKVSDCWATVWM